MYFLDRHPEFGRRAAALVALAKSFRFYLVVSLSCQAEVLVQPVAQASEFRIAQARRFFSTPLLESAPFTPGAMNRFVQLRAEHRVKPMDALHPACAAEAAADLFITNDERLTRPPCRASARSSGSIISSESAPCNP